MNGEKNYQNSYQTSDMSITHRIADYLKSKHTSAQLKKLLETPKIQKNELIRISVYTAEYSKRFMESMGSDEFKISHKLRWQLKNIFTRLKFELGLGKLPLDNIESEINRAIYLQYFHKNYIKAQKIYRHYAQQYLDLYLQNTEKAEKKFNSLHNLEKNTKYWISANSYLGNAMADAIGLLTSFHVQNESYELLRELAKAGHGIAILRLNTRKDEQAPSIIMSFFEDNEFAFGKVVHEFLNEEEWAVDAFCWNKDKEGQVTLKQKTKAIHLVSFMEAVESGNMLAFEHFEKQQEDPEVIERLDVIKRIFLLDINIRLLDEEEMKSADGGYGRKVESVPYQTNYKLQSVLPKLENEMFIKICEAVDKYPNWKHAKILLAECYKLAIGTEQSLLKAFGHFVMVRDMDYMNNNSINFVDGCYLSNTKEVIEPLKALTNVFQVDSTLQELQISKECIEKNNSVSLYPDIKDVFAIKQAWLSKHFMPIINVGLGLLKEEWKGVELPILLAYEPDGHKCQFIGEKTEVFHNQYLNQGWYSFKLTDDNKYEFLGDEEYFFATEHQDTDGMINTRKDIQYRKELYQKTGDLHIERYRSGSDILELVDENEPYFILGGDNRRDFNCIPPNHYIYLDNKIVTMDDKPLYHIATINKAYFAKYYQIGDISVFFEPETRLVLYSCKHTRVC